VGIRRIDRRAYCASWGSTAGRRLVGLRGSISLPDFQSGPFQHMGSCDVKVTELGYGGNQVG
jgi:hypothetical protein